MTTWAVMPLAAFCAPLAAETGSASFARAAKPSALSAIRSADRSAVSAGNLSATPLPAAPGYAQKPQIVKISPTPPSSFRMAASATMLQASSSCPASGCDSDRVEALPDGFEAERLKRTVELYAGDVDMGRTPSHLSARMGYIRQGKNAAEPTRRGALALCDRHIDNCRAEINPHEMQLNPIAKELIFNRNRAGKSFDEHVGVKLTYQFR